MLNQVYGTIFLTRDQKVLLVKGRHTGKWSFPKGHPNDGEGAFECARRETYEETGYKMPPFFERVLQLSTGMYFLVNASEFNCQPQDTQEIVGSMWVPIESMRSMSVNIDVSAFLRHNGLPTQSKSAKYSVRPVIL
jgi:8-oxo-dGTP pyrophosphatase MutT (NUDIX family)